MNARSMRPFDDQSNILDNEPASLLKPPRVVSRTPKPEPVVGTGLRGSNGAVPVRKVNSTTIKRRPAKQLSTTARPAIRSTARGGNNERRPDVEDRGRDVSPETPQAANFTHLEEKLERKLDERLQQQLTKTQEQVMDSHKQMIIALQSQSTSLQETNSNLSGDVNRIAGERDLLAKRLEDEQKATSDLREQIMEEKLKLANAQGSLDRTKEKYEEAMALYKSAQKRCDEIKEEQSQATQATSNEMTAAMEIRYATLESSLQETERRKLHLESELDGLRKKLFEAERAGREARESLSSKEADLHRSERNLGEVEKDLQSTKEQLRENQRLVQSLELSLTETKTQCEKDVAAKSTALEQAAVSLQTAEDELGKLKENIKEKDHKIENLNEGLSETCQKLKKVDADLLAETSEVARVKMARDELEMQHKAKVGELLESKKEVEDANKVIADQRSDAEQLRFAIEALRNDLAEEKEKLAKEEEIRQNLEIKSKEQEQSIAEFEAEVRTLNNLVQELKGNIRVFCRVRPALNEAEKASDILQIESGKKGITSVMPTNGDQTPVKHPFEFDRVFHGGCSQEEVFTEVEHVIRSSLEGYRVCLFAYGQTGSGKTHTMMGDVRKDSDQAGIIPRAIRLIFEEADKLKGENWDFTLNGSFLEIYQETIRDLLADSGTNQQYNIKMRPDKSGDMYVPELTSVELSSPEDVMQLLRRSEKNRTTAATKMNERSSRSHSILRLEITGYSHDTRQNVKGIVNLIDLAGSERLKKSGATGDRMNEARKINASLSSLGDVIQALANKASHVPYRNSKLTHLLMDSLGGGQSKTLMFVNLSPAESSAQETLQSLRFAKVVHSCDIGTATRSQKIDLGLKEDS